MHWQISTQTSTKYCFCVSRDKKIQCISSASKQQQFKDNESLYLWIYLKSKTSISIEEKNTAHLEGLENGSENGPKRSVERTTGGVKLLLPIIITKYNRCHYSFLRQQVTGGLWLGPGARLPRLLCLGSDQFPAKTASRLVRVSDQEICGY